jgi:hypothetical protein
MTLLVATTLLAACAALPNDAPVVEQIDQETGVTIARLGRPVELYHETTRREKFSRFGFLGPFETNQMGKREMFLMIALPLDEESEPGTPTLQVDGSVVALGEVGRGADLAGLKKSPYQLSTPWIAMFYFRTDNDTITKLGRAGQITVRIAETSPGGTVETEFRAAATEDARLQKFATR